MIPSIKTFKSLSYSYLFCNSDWADFTSMHLLWFKLNSNFNHINRLNNTCSKHTRKATNNKRLNFVEQWWIFLICSCHYLEIIKWRQVNIDFKSYSTFQMTLICFLWKLYWKYFVHYSITIQIYIFLYKQSR